MNSLEKFNSLELFGKHEVSEAPDAGEFALHVHSRYEIYVFCSGRAQYLVEGSVYPLERGSVLILRPGESHAAKILESERYERYAINFSASLVSRVDPRRQLLRAFDDRPLGRGNLYTAEELGAAAVESTLADVHLSAEQGYESYLDLYSRLFSLLRLIDAAFVRRGISEYKPPESLPEQILSYLNAHLFEELTVAGLAEHFFLSRSQFCRIFRETSGKTPWEYVTQKRLTAAREMIEAGASVSVAAEACGYGDYSAFYRAYVKLFGTSPSHQKGIRPS
jgi:AraC-like DNA-binding protein